MAILCTIRWLMVFLTLSSITTIHGQTCTPGQLRLFESASFSSSNFSNAGRVEVCVGGVWGTIAADSIATPWSEKNAQVACIQLGFTGALNAVFQRTIPFVERSTSPIHLSAVICNGTESRIIDCPHLNSTQNVDHGFDAYIVCRPRDLRYSYVHPAGLQSGDVRLFGDTRNGYGAVQIYTITLGWQGICPDTFWSHSDASTICQHLGYDDGSVATPIDAVRGPGGESLLRNLYDTKCPGRSSDDITTVLCSFRIESSVARCVAPEGRFAAVRCNYVSDQSVRLIGGSHNQEGIVEIAYNGRWGMLCSGRFQLPDAQSICQGLGFGTDDASVMSVSSTSRILDSESNLRPIWLNNLDCSSSDNNLPSCIREQNIIGFANCLSSSIAAVDCGDPPPLTPGQIAGITIGVLVFVAIVVPLLVICLDENKKRATIAKLKAAKARIAQIQVPRPRLPRRQPRCRSARAPSVQPSTSEPPQPEPSNSGPPSNNNQTAAPQVPEASSAPQSPEPPQDSSHFSKRDEPPPYPGGPAYPPPFPASVNYQGYPPPAWSNPAYPPPAEPLGVYPTNDTPRPADSSN